MSCLRAGDEQLQLSTGFKMNLYNQPAASDGLTRRLRFMAPHQHQSVTVSHQPATLGLTLLL